MEPELTKWFADLGVVGALAGVMFYFYQKNAQGQIERERDNAADWKAEAERRRTEAGLLIDLVRSNTAAFTMNTEAVRSNTEVVRALAQRLDK